MKRQRKIILLCFLLTFVGSTAYAWQTVWPSATHKEITSQAISILPKDADGKDLYPDAQKRVSDLRNGSHEESHNSIAQPYGNDNSLNGGLPEVWWYYALENNYKRWQIANAYFNLGRTFHLIQDQAVPAHAANILHVLDLLPTFRLSRIGLS
ncbi:MAG: hypothetical protein KKH28_14895 [Elusimicrobia bacterium]|nr:hypothetical protein [Elusimicrobiota bacterium]